MIISHDIVINRNAAHLSPPNPTVCPDTDIDPIKVSFWATKTSKQMQFTVHDCSQREAKENICKQVATGLHLLLIGRQRCQFFKANPGNFDAHEKK